MPEKICLLCLLIKLLVKTPLRKKALDLSSAPSFFNNSTIFCFISLTVLTHEGVYRYLLYGGDFTILLYPLRAFLKNLPEIEI